MVKRKDKLVFLGMAIPLVIIIALIVISQFLPPVEVKKDKRDYERIPQPVKPAIIRPCSDFPNTSCQVACVEQPIKGDVVAKEVKNISNSSK